MKAGVVPLHVWLPEAHPAAPSSVSALMSGGLVNAGLYGLVRVGAGGLGRPDAALGHGHPAPRLACRRSWACSTRSSENDLKRLLAFSTIENGGIALMALGAGMIGARRGAPRARRRSAWPPASTTCSTTRSSRACSSWARAV